MLTRVVSGGQTGVDRAALDAALECGLAVGGWCPKGRLAEDGVIPDRYPLSETASADYAVRTRRNVHESDATLIVTIGPPTDGTAYTVEVAARAGKPYLVVDLLDRPDPAEARRWLELHRVSVLNVAGPRESKCPGIHQQAAAYLRGVLAA